MRKFSWRGVRSGSRVRLAGFSAWHCHSSWGCHSTTGWNLVLLDFCLDMGWIRLHYSEIASPGKHSSSRFPLLLALSIGVRGERRSNAFGQREELSVDLVYLVWDLWVLNSCGNGEMLFSSASLLWGGWSCKCALAISRESNRSQWNSSGVWEWRCRESQSYQDIHPSEDALRP